ncbi:MAG: HD domain-containing protein [Chitinophagaceae bacterium]|nr:HD domain-containing protein [Rubrivivax sp.]
MTDAQPSTDLAADSPTKLTADDGVNSNYLDHMVATARQHEVVVSEDILTKNGVKLLGKGARIGDAVRDRLLQHKLLKPLEDCTEVLNGVTAAQFEAVGHALFDQHPLMRALCSIAGSREAPSSLAALTLSAPVKSLLTVYSQCRPRRLEHAVGVAMLSLSLARRLMPGAIDRHRTLALAGLLHDIGELYIDPVPMSGQARLDASQWRHVAIHPLLGHRVLNRMAGAGKAVAEAVLLHHERLDGFGYPHGVSGDAFSDEGEIIAAAEWLMGLLESGAAPLVHARMASQLVPGELRPALVKLLATMTPDAPDLKLVHGVAPPLEEVLPRILRVARRLDNFVRESDWMNQRIAAASPALRAVLEAGRQRLQRIQVSFASTGLAVENAATVLDELAAQRDPGVYVEITALVTELEWRMREIERRQRLRGSLLPAADGAVVEESITRVRGTSAAVAEAAA